MTKTISFEEPLLPTFETFVAAFAERAERDKIDEAIKRRAGHLDHLHVAGFALLKRRFDKLVRVVRLYHFTSFYKSESVAKWRRVKCCEGREKCCEMV
jgi:hypothetical protein